MIDLLLALIVVVSALLGLLRGFVAIVISLLAWLLAGWAAYLLGESTAQWLADAGQPGMSHLFAGYALSFGAVLVGVHVMGMLLKSTVQATRLTGLDRMLGLGLGAARGMLIACVLVLVAGFTPVREHRAWHESLLLPAFAPAALWMRAQLPEWSAPALPSLELPDALPEVGIGRPSGDNGGVQTLPMPLLEQIVSRNLERVQTSGTTLPAGKPSPDTREPAGQDPAEIRPGQADPANVDPPGQERPRSKQS